MGSWNTDRVYCEREPERGVAVAERVYVTCYGFPTEAGIEHRRMRYTGYNVPLRRPTLCFPLSRFRHDSNNGDDDSDDDSDNDRDNDGRPPAAIVIAAENCRSPEAVKHVPLILPPLDDDCLIYAPTSADVLSLLSSPRRPRRARWLIAQTSLPILRCPSPLSPRHSAPLPSTASRITATPCPLSTPGHVQPLLLITYVASTHPPLRRRLLAPPNKRGTLERERLQRHQLHLPIGRDSAFYFLSLSFVSHTQFFSSPTTGHRHLPW